MGSDPIDGPHRRFGFFIRNRHVRPNAVVRGVFWRNDARDALMAEALGKTEDAAAFRADAEKTFAALAPLNVINRFFFGVTPLEPGFAKASVKPQPGGLRHLVGTVPTPRGAVKLELTDEGGSWRVALSTPVPVEFTLGDENRSLPTSSHGFSLAKEKLK